MDPEVVKKIISFSWFELRISRDMTKVGLNSLQTPKKHHVKSPIRSEGLNGPIYAIPEMNEVQVKAHKNEIINDRHHKNAFIWKP